ncbi:MAG: TIGR03086 family metal-binding protein [Acidimicrobiales bacterium]
MDPSEQLAVILPSLTALVDQLEPGDLANPTPCANFTLRDVLEHMIGGATSFAPAFRGEQPSGAEASPGVAGAVPVSEFRRAMDDLLDAVRSPGAMERTVSAPFGDVPGSVFARFVAFDGLIHGYDMATSAGLSYDPPADVVAAVDAFARDAVGADMRDGDTFAAATVAPAGATELLQLVAFTGRTV